MSGDAWSAEENGAIVADYLEMLRDELVRRPFSTAACRRALLPRRRGRSEGSIEFKHQNVSAVLQDLGETWIAGYKPAFNFRASLVDAVAQHLAIDPAGLTPLPRTAAIDELLEVHPAPTMRNAPPPKEAEQLAAVARKFDIATNQAANRALERAGEERVLGHERARLRQAGREDLAPDVRRVPSRPPQRLYPSTPASPHP